MLTTQRPAVSFVAFVRFVAWRAFKSALVDRFTSQMEYRKVQQKMRSPKHKGDTQTYLAALEEINS